MSISHIEEDDEDDVPRVLFTHSSVAPETESYRVRRKSKETSILQATVLLEDALSRRNAEVIIN
jgi:hypothetical protein